MKRTIVISCAGKGSRLGKGIPKCLLDIAGKPLIIRQLELLKDEKDIHIVVGYQADRVVEVVHQYRTDVKWYYNDDWEHTGTAASFRIGAADAQEMVVALDGDLLVKPRDMHRFLQCEVACVCGCVPGTDEPVLMQVTSADQVTGFSRQKGQWEWTGLMQIPKEQIYKAKDAWHVYHILESLLPLQAMKIETREIDTPHDYQEALDWFEKIMTHMVVDDFWLKQSRVEDRYIASRFHKNDRLIYDAEYVKRFATKESNVLDLGCGTGLMEDVIYDAVGQITAIDRFPEFLKQTNSYQNVEYLCFEVEKYCDRRQYDLIIMWGLTMYLDDEAMQRTIANCKTMLRDQGVLLIKNQWGINDRVHQPLLCLRHHRHSGAESDAP